MASTVSNQQIQDALNRIEIRHGRGVVLHVQRASRKAVVRIPNAGFELQKLPFKLVRRTVFFRGHQYTIPKAVK